MRKIHIALFLCFQVSILWGQDVIEEATLTILGSALSVSPEDQTVPLETPTVLKTFLGSNGQPISLDPSYKVVGELTGPQFDIPISLSTFPNEDFQIPGFSVPGDYFLENIRLVKDGRLVMYATPKRAHFLATQVLVTRVETRPLTLEEIQSRGIVIDSSNFKVIELSIGLKLESDTYDISFPIVFTEEGPQVIPNNMVGGVPMQQNVSFNLPQVDPFQLELDDLALPDDINKEDIPEVSIPGVIMIPTDIAFLHQFFSVMLIAKNNAPSGDPLTIRDLKAKLYLPQALREAETNPPVPMGTFVPVKDPGYDGILGTGDDLTIIIAQAEGKAEWNVEGLEEGNHIVSIEMYGTLEGLPVGPIPIRSKTKGMVVVRDPTFAFNVSHPAVVRRDEYYDMFLTITNTSNVPANLVTVKAEPSQIAGSQLIELEGPEGSEQLDENTIRIDTLEPKNSVSVRYRMLALQTGKVVATASNTSSSSSSLTISLTVGVGEGGIPLSPTSLIFPPFIDNLPYEISRFCIDLLGLGYSLATAPAGSVPPEMPILAKSTIQRRGWELALSARYIQLGLSPFDAVSKLVLDWLGNTSPEANFDKLRRVTEKGKRFAEEVEKVWNEHLEEPENSLTDFLEDYHSFNCDTNPYILVLLEGADKAMLGIYHWEQGTFSQDDYHHPGWQRDVEGVEIFRLQDSQAVAQLGVIGLPLTSDDNGQMVPYNYQVQIYGREGVNGDSVSLKILKGDSQGNFQILDYGSFPVYYMSQPSAIVNINIDSVGNLFKNGVAQGIAPNTTSLFCPDFQVIQAVQDTMADPIGRAATLLLNQRVSPEEAEAINKYTLEAQLLPQYADKAPISTQMKEIFDVKVQPDGKTIILSFKNPLSPFADSTLTIDNLISLKGDILNISVPVTPQISPEGAVVVGQVINGYGEPVPFAPVELWEEDYDSLRGEAFKHITAITKTNIEGYYLFDYVRSGSSATIKGYDPSTGDFGEVNYRTSPEALHWLNIVMLAKGNIKGKVVYSDGSPVTDGEVIAQSSVFGEHKRVRVDETTGEYFIPMMPVGNVSLTAKDPSGRIAYNNVYISYAGQVVSQDLVLPKQQPPGVGNIQGFVYFADGEPVSNTYVGIYKVINGNETLLAFDTTLEDGSFGFSNVPEGSVNLKAYDPRTNKIGGNAFAEIIKDSTVNANIVIYDRFGRISGVVKRIDENYDEVPVSNAIVYLENTQFVTVTDDDGSYSLDNLPYGNYKVKAVSVEHNEQASENVMINESNNDAVVNFLLSSPRGKIIGLVKDENGNPVASARVVLVVGGYAGKTTVSSSDGTFTFDDLPVGTYTIHASLSSYRAGKGTVTISYPGQTAQLMISFMGYRNIKVLTRQISGENSNPVSVPVKYRHYVVDEFGIITFMENYETIYSNDAGEAYIENVLASGVQIVAGDPVFGQKQVQFDLPKGEGDYEVLIELATLCKIKGRVLDYMGNPVAGAKVYLAKYPNAYVLTAEDGSYEFSALAKDYYTIIGEHSNGALRKGMTSIHLTYDGQVFEGADIHLPKLGNVKVIVYDGSTAVEGASVTLQEMEFPYRNFTFTTQQGDSEAFAYFPNIVEGSFSVTATYLLGSTTLSGRANGLIQEEGETVRVEVTLEQYGEMSGTVVGPDGVGVNNCQVILSGRVSDYTTTVYNEINQTDGYFYFPYLPYGTYSISVLDPASGRSGRADNLVLDSQNNALNVSIILEARGTVEGDVLYPDLTRVSPFAQVRLRSFGIHPFETYTSADMDGRFTFAGISQGTYELFATAIDTPRQGKAQGSIDYEGEVKETDVILQQAGYVQGIVKDANGNSFQGDALITFKQTMLNGASYTQDVSGNSYTFEEVLVDKPFHITAKTGDPSDQSAYYFGEATGQLTHEGEEKNVDVQFYPKGTVIVKVYQNGQPISGAEVHLQSKGPYGTSMIIQNDTSNTFTFLNVGYGAFNVYAEYNVNGTIIKGSNEGFLTYQGEEVSVDINLEETGTIKGRVLLPDGNPAAFAQLVLNAGGRTFYFHAGSDGLFEFNYVPVGTFTLKIYEDNQIGYLELIDQSIAKDEIKDYGDLILDRSPLQIESIEPADGTTDVVTDIAPLITFNANIREDSLNSQYFKLKQGSTYISTSITYFSDTEKNKVILQPLQPLESSTLYIIEISRDVKEETGVKLGTTVVTSFTTRDAQPPQVIAITPASDPDCLHPLSIGDGNIIVSFDLLFSEPVDPASVNGDNIILTLLNDGSIIPGGIFTFEDENKKVRATYTDKTLQPNERYQITVQNIGDLSGNIMEHPGNYYFCTKDTDIPVVQIQLDPGIVNFEVVENQSYTLTANIADEDIEKVEWVVNDQLQQTNVNPPYTYTFTAPLLSSGVTTLTIEAKAYDYSGNMGHAEVVLTVIQDAPPIITEFTIDPSGDVLPNTTITVQVKAYDRVSLQSVSLIVSGTYSENQEVTKTGCTNPQEPCPITFEVLLPPDTPPGQVNFKSQVTDTFSNITESQELSIQVIADSEAPTITDVSPQDGYVITEGAEFTASCNATDNVKVKEVTFSLDGNDYAITGPSYQVELTAPAVETETQKTLTITAEDYAGNQASESIHIIVQPVVDPDAPTVAFQCPGDGAIFPENYRVPLTVIARDNTSINTIEYYAYNGSQWELFKTFVVNETNMDGVEVERTTTYLLPEVMEDSTRKFKVVAYDANNPPKTGESIITITVKNIDENVVMIDQNDVTINENDNNYNNKTIIIKGKTLTIIKHQSNTAWVPQFENLILIDGGMVTQPDTTPTDAYELNFKVNNQLYIQCGYTDSEDANITAQASKIDVTGKGYRPGYTYPNTTKNGNVHGNGGSHAGLSGRHIGEYVTPVYGSFNYPTCPGAGGRTASGGGVVWIRAASLVNNGEIIADGMSGDHGGAGGSILIDVGVIGGNGEIRANGGVGYWKNSEGGGGRVAVYYQSDATGGDNGLKRLLHAKGGGKDADANYGVGGAGTVYVKQEGQVYGDLVVDNTGVPSSDRSHWTVLPSLGEGTTGSFTWVDEANRVAKVEGCHSEVVILDDEIPDGIILDTGYDNWVWVDDVVYSGVRAHKSDNHSGSHWHNLYGASIGFPIPEGSSIVQWVYIPSDTPPRDIGLNFRMGNNWKGVYWSESPRNYSDLLYIGELPTVQNEWVKLEVSPEQVAAAGLAGHVVDGVSYYLYDGSIYWDDTAVEVNKFRWNMAGLTMRVWLEGGDSVDLGIIGNGDTDLFSGSLLVEVPEEVVDLSVLASRPYRGVIKLDNLEVKGGARLYTEDLIEVQGDWVLEGEGVIDGEIAIENLTISGGSMRVDGDLDVSGDLTITNGAEFTYSGELDVGGNMYLKGNSVLTHPDTTPEREYYLYLKVNGSLEIEAGSKIDVTGRGYIERYTYPNVMVEDIRQRSGSYGGYGGVSSGRTAIGVYGSFMNPLELGSGGDYPNITAGDGGGLVIIDAGSLVVNGAIIADGEGSSDWWEVGSGGGINIRVRDSIDGENGVISAVGGAGGRGGGGGRVAIYGDFVDFKSINIFVNGFKSCDGCGVKNGGAGTLFLMGSSDTFGRLIVDNTGGGASNNGTYLPSVGSGIIDAAAWYNDDPNSGMVIMTDDQAQFPWSLEGLYLRVSDFPYAGGTEDFRILGNVTEGNDSSALYLEADPTTDITSLIGKTYSGVIKLDELTVKGNAFLTTDDLIEVTGNLIFVESGSKLCAPNIQIPEGGCNE